MRPITAADVMNPNVLLVREDMTLDELAGFLIENEISGAPVQDAEGRLVGVVSVTDVTQAVASEGEADRSDFYIREWGGILTRESLPAGGAELRVRDIMNPVVYSVDEQTPIPEVAATLIQTHIHRLLVTRGGGGVVGILTTSDLLGLLVRERE